MVAGEREHWEVAERLDAASWDVPPGYGRELANVRCPECGRHRTIVRTQGLAAEVGIERARELPCPRRSAPPGGELRCDPIFWAGDR